MNNFGGKIRSVDQWVSVIPANPARTLATVANTSFAPGQEFDRNGVNFGPPIWVWPYATDPTTLSGGPADIGAFLLAKPGDAVAFTGAATQAAIYVFVERVGSSVAASEY